LRREDAGRVHREPKSRQLGDPQPCKAADAGSGSKRPAASGKARDRLRADRSGRHHRPALCITSDGSRRRAAPARAKRSTTTIECHHGRLGGVIKPFSRRQRSISAAEEKFPIRLERTCRPRAKRAAVCCALPTSVRIVGVERHAAEGLLPRLLPRTRAMVGSRAGE
jgi:hypothetical protein